MFAILYISHQLEIFLKKAGIGALVGFFFPIVFMSLGAACFMWFVAPSLLRPLIDPTISEQTIKLHFTIWGMIAAACGGVIGFTLQGYLLQTLLWWKLFGIMSAIGAFLVLNKI